MLLPHLLFLFLFYSTTQASNKIFIDRPLNSIYFQYGLDQNHNSLNKKHENYCGYYALYFALCFNKSADYKEALNLIRQRYSRAINPWSFNAMLPEWEKDVSTWRGIIDRKALSSEIDWLDGEELAKLISENAQKVFFEKYNTASIAQYYKARRQAAKISRGKKLDTPLKKEATVQAKYLLLSPWYNIMVIDQLEDNETIASNPEELKKIKNHATILKISGTPQSVIIGLKKHWICVGFRKESSFITMTIHNSSKIPDSMNTWYEELYEYFCNPDAIKV